MCAAKDGKKFKLFSLKKMSEEFVRLPEKATEVRTEKGMNFTFPDPDYASLRLPGGHFGHPLVSLSR